MLVSTEQLIARFQRAKLLTSRGSECSIGSVKPQAAVIAEHHGEQIDAQVLESLPESLWSCCLKDRYGLGCCYRNRLHEHETPRK